MPLDYYYRLSRRKQAIYLESDRVIDVTLNNAGALAPSLASLREALKADSLKRVQRAVDVLSQKITDDLAIEPVTVKVRARRPRAADGEYYGLYERIEGELALIQVWMRTASRKQVVAFRTFLRTLIHEVCHHLDFTYLGLSETFHTEGFFKRESSLMRQLVPPRAKHPDAPKKRKKRLNRVDEKLKSDTKPGEQLELF